MLLDVRHTTHYTYPSPPRRIIQALRLWPAPCEHQHSRSWEVRVAGRLVEPGTIDSLGNSLQVHAVEGPLDSLEVEVLGRIEVDEVSGIVRGTQEPLPSAFYLGSTMLTAADQAIVRLARDARSDDLLATLHAMMGEVRARIDFSDQHTDAETPAAQALQLGAGVCQDHAHVMIAGARVLGLPARYVSGYLWLADEKTEPASHAWCEIEVADLGWVGFDAANCVCPTDGYVRVAVGRDAREAAPIRGCREGGAGETMLVEVAVSSSKQAQQ